MVEHHRQVAGLTLGVVGDRRVEQPRVAAPELPLGVLGDADRETSSHQVAIEQSVELVEGLELGGVIGAVFGAVVPHTRGGGQRDREGGGLLVHRHEVVLGDDLAARQRRGAE